MGYSTNEGMVRVDFFRSTGKWATTEAVDMSDFYALFPKEGLAAALHRHLSGGRLRGLWAVCLEPYSEHAFPVMMEVL